MNEIVERMEIEPTVKRAMEDKVFRKEFIKNPKTVLERELGFKFADDVKIKVHQERLREVHIVLPAVLEEADVEGQGWSDRFIGTSTVGGVRG